MFRMSHVLNNQNVFGFRFSSHRVRLKRRSSGDQHRSGHRRRTVGRGFDI